MEFTNALRSLKRHIKCQVTKYGKKVGPEDISPHTLWYVFTGDGVDYLHAEEMIE